MDNKDKEKIFVQVGFKNAFKATLGFYAAQSLITITFIIIVISTIWVLK